MNRLLAVVVAVAIPLVSRAQGVPLVAFDLTAGSSDRGTLQTAHTYYGLSRPSLLRAAATLRVGTAGRFRPVITAEYGASCPVGCGDNESCVTAPVGTCSQHLPDLEGKAIGGGVAGRFGRLLLIQATGGVADYWDHARYADVSVAFSPASHFAVVADLRQIAGHDRLGDDLWFFPKSFGIRVY